MFESSTDVPRNVTVNTDISNGGILATFVVNSFVAVLMLLTFLCCFRRLTLYNVEKKSALRRKVHQIKRQREALRSTETMQTTAKRQHSSNMSELTIGTPTAEDEEHSEQLSDAPLPQDSSQPKLYIAGSLGNSITRHIRSVLSFFIEGMRSLLFNSWFMAGRKRDWFSWANKLSNPRFGMYYMFQQHVIWAMFLCLVLAIAILLPLHMTGELPVFRYEDTHSGSFNITTEDYPLLRTTVSMIIANPWKMYIHVALNYVFVALFGFFLYRFHSTAVQTASEMHQNIYGAPKTEKENPISPIGSASQQQQQYLRPHEEFDDITNSLNNNKEPPLLFSEYSVKITGLPKDMTKKSHFRTFIHELFKSEDIKVVKQVLVLNVSTRVELQEQWEDTVKGIDHFKWYLDNGYKEPIKTFVCSTETVGKVDALKFFEAKKKNIERRIKEWDTQYSYVLLEDAQDPKLPQIEGSGVGYVVLQSPKDVILCLQKFKEYTFNYDQNLELEDDFNIELEVEANLESNATRYSINIVPAEEPVDINWRDLVKSNQRYPMFRNLLIHAVIILCFIFFSTPVAAFSAIQSVANVGIVKWSLSTIQYVTGFFGNVIFQWLPTLLMLLCALFIPYVIKKTNKLEFYSTMSEYKRKLLVRNYVYCLISIFVLPSLTLSSLDNLLIYIKDKDNLDAVLRNMFLPSAGAFFINLILQMAILKNAEDVLSIFTLVKYIVHRFCCAAGILCRRALTHEELYEAAKSLQFEVEREYAIMLACLTIILSYSLLSPVIMIVGFLFFIIKHFVDRFVIEHVLHESNDSDFEQQQVNMISPELQASFDEQYKYIQLLSKMMLINLAIFTLVMCFFFSLRGNSNYIPHTLAVSALFLVIMLVFVVFYFVFPMINKGQFIEQLRAISPSAPILHRMVYCEKKHVLQVSDSRLENAYELPYKYIHDVKNSTMNVESRKDSLVMHF